VVFSEVLYLCWEKIKSFEILLTEDEVSRNVGTLYVDEEGEREV